VELYGATQAAIRAAEEAGASEVGPAALYLKLAREEKEQGKKLVEAGKYALAELVLRRAAADGELAVELTKQAKKVREAERREKRAVELRAQVGQP
jgi:hypothetical protein